MFQALIIQKSCLHKPIFLSRSLLRKYFNRKRIFIFFIIRDWILYFSGFLKTYHLYRVFFVIKEFIIVFSIFVLSFHYFILTLFDSGQYTFIVVLVFIRRVLRRRTFGPIILVFIDVLVFIINFWAILFYFCTYILIECVFVDFVWLYFRIFIITLHFFWFCNIIVYILSFVLLYIKILIAIVCIVKTR